MCVIAITLFYLMQDNTKSAEVLGAPIVQNAVRDKAVAILGLALISPSELTPHEAAVAVEAAVFDKFAEHGVAGIRSVPLLHHKQLPIKAVAAVAHISWCCQAK